MVDSIPFRDVSSGKHTRPNLLFDNHRSIAMCEGRPTGVREFTYDVEILPLCEDHRISTRLKTLASSIHGWRATLTEHCNRFSTINSLCIANNARLDALNDLGEALIRWRDRITPAHRPESSVVDDWESYMLVAPLHLEYFNLMRALHWASFISVTTQRETIDDRHKGSARTSEMRCLSAARSIVQTLNRFVLKVANL